MILGLTPAGARRWGAGLIAFGVVGLFLVGAAVVMLVAAGPSLDQVGSVADRTGPTRLALQSASRTLDTLATSATSLDATLEASQRSLADASTAGGSLADALGALAAATDVQILGGRPLAGVGDRLVQAGDGVRRVSDDLGSLATRLGEHAGQAGTIGEDAAALKAQVDEIEASLAGPPGLGLTGSLAVIRLVLMGLLAWLGVLAGACVYLGRRIRGVT